MSGKIKKIGRGGGPDAKTQNHQVDFFLYQKPTLKFQSYLTGLFEKILKFT